MRARIDITQRQPDYPSGRDDRGYRRWRHRQTAEQAALARVQRVVTGATVRVDRSSGPSILKDGTTASYRVRLYADIEEA